MSENDKHWDELELYRIKLFKWDRYIAVIIPLLILPYLFYQVDGMSNVIYICLLNVLIVVLTVNFVTPRNFQLFKTVHFIGIVGMVTYCTVFLPVIRNEFFMMPLLMLTAFSYPYKRKSYNIATGLICIIFAIMLFLTEFNQHKKVLTYDFFNEMFKITMVYITIVEVIIIYLIDNKYKSIIKKDTTIRIINSN